MKLDSLLFILPVLLSFLIFLFHGKVRDWYVLLLTLIIVVITSVPAIALMFDSGQSIKTVFIGFQSMELRFTIDSLSAFFILVVNFICLTGILFSKGYLKPYLQVKSQMQFSLHYFSYQWLHLSMLGVLMFREGIPFLISWELMAVSSFMLILFEAEKRTTLKTAVNYLVQMHVGFALLMIAFLICEAGTGRMSFDALPSYFSNHANIWLVLLFFAGFAIKAGFIPFHTWLPEAHPAAPSHVSGVMSGVMIKMGIYGIIRVLMSVQSDLYSIGVIILAISVISGLLGVTFSIVHQDIKKLLAYCSIENIGIIGIGIGTGTIGLAVQNPMMVFFGFAGALLHVLNHSLAKSLLFFSSGSVYQAYHSRNIDQLGGVIHKMPVTSGFFLIGSIAICGLPPLNGFISEILIYFGLFNGLLAGSKSQSIILILTIISLTLMGGLSIFTFTKTFGLAFLGSPRNKENTAINEVPAGILFPQYLIAGVIIVIGLMPFLFIQPIIKILSQRFPLLTGTSFLSIASIFSGITQLMLILAGVFLLLFYLRYRMMKRKVPVIGPTWGCGYTAATPRQQYTGTSYADNIAELAAPILQSRTKFKPIAEENIFPGKHTFAVQPTDVFNSFLKKLLDFIMLVLKKLARLQTGNIQHYILYAFVFILIIFALLYLRLI